jgi:hypothetical protein
MLTIVRSVAVLDRTGKLQHALRSQGLDVLDLRATEFDDDPPDVDVLLIGEQELTSAGFRRMARWRRLNPAGAVVAHVGEVEPHFGDLRAAGVQHVVRGRPTPAKMRNVLRRVDLTLAELVVAAGRFTPESFDEVLDLEDEVDDTVDAYPAEPYEPRSFSPSRQRPEVAARRSSPPTPHRSSPRPALVCCSSTWTCSSARWQPHCRSSTHTACTTGCTERAANDCPHRRCGNTSTTSCTITRWALTC